MNKYKHMEESRGEIAEDSLIYKDGDRYHIPTASADHFNDMVRGK
jgi:hypothetical protein